ncbi:MAG: 3-phosphoserine/phosphohydroxythreonine transaminase [Firmicutes bacterium]|nr:3-phosphoserine/phosphohydroxythreonine transaminase [Bacillota bacterium]
MIHRVYNFNPGPATLPLPVLEKAREELLDYRGTGMSVMEISHRSSDFEEIITSAEASFLELAGLNNRDYRVLFLQGGASLQFMMVPYNFLPDGKTADYIETGIFAEKAQKEASRIGKTHIVASTKDTGYRSIPRQEDLSFSPDPAYVHLTTNNTIYGTQWKYIPDCGDVPLVADMSSDILSREIDLTKFSLFYAGAQKNLGPAGVTAVVIRKSMLERVPENIPNIFSYKVHAESGSLYNTPPCFPIYILQLVMEWLKDQGGLKAIEILNEKKASLIYEAIDRSENFYRGHAQKECRSTMNITFRLPDEKMEKLFLEEAAKEGLMGLKGHRSVGGIRASIYNAMPLEGCETLAQFMEDFCNKHKA